MSAHIASAITKAIAKGFTARSILNHLMRQYPQYANTIANATALGYTADKILKHLVDPRGKNPDDDSFLTDSEKADKIDRERKRKVAIKTGMAGLAAAGGIAGLNALRARQAAQLIPGLAQQSQIGSQVQGQLPYNPPQLPGPQSPAPSPQPSPTPSPMQMTPGQQVAQEINTPTPPEQTAQAAQAIQPQDLFTQIIGNVDINTLPDDKKQELAFIQMVAEKFQKEGKTISDPAVIALKKKASDIIKKGPGLLQQESQRFENAYPQEAIQTKNEPTLEKITKDIESSPIESPKSVSKGETVVTPTGLGEVKGISGNNFLVEEDGKLKKIPMDQLKGQPEAIQKAEVVFDPNTIPEEDRSAALAISIPLPDRSAILNMFHDGSFYIYRRKDGKPIDESIVRRIIDGTDIPMTKGSTYMGAFDPEKGDSRGSANYKELTKMSQKAGDPDDPKKPLIFEKITDSFIHGYLKKFMELIREANKQFVSKKVNKPEKKKNEKRKKKAK